MTKILIEMDGTFLDEVKHNAVELERAKRKADDAQNKYYELLSKYNAIKNMCRMNCKGNAYMDVMAKDLAKTAHEPIEEWVGYEVEEEEE